MASTKAVDAPISAVTHIQNTAPGPPAEIAATTPTMLPIPTLVAVDTMSACTPEIAPPFPSVSRLTIRRSISGKHRTGSSRVRTVKYRPVGIRRATSREMPIPPPMGIVNKSPQRKLYTAEIIPIFYTS